MKVKLQKRLKEAYWNYLRMIQQIVEERKEENRGSHMGRKGLLNKSHTEQDRKAEELANDGERQAEKVHTPRRLWIIENNEGLCIHSKIRKSAEKEVKNRIFQTYMDEKENNAYKRADLRKAIGKVQTTNTETQVNWNEAIEEKYGGRGLKYLTEN